jgi:hypothetical protein
MNIDWSKAPEGATHKHPFGWYKRVEDKWFFTPLGVSDWKQSIHKWTDNEFLAVRPTEQSAWNGEGLPPVGTLCRLTIGEWAHSNARITHMGKGVFCYEVSGTEYTGSVCDATFTPIKSERDQQIDALLSIFQTLPYFVFSRDMAADLYDEGVRVEK